MTNPVEGAAGDLVITATLTIPDAELAVTFQTSGGPGGQHANKSATGVVLVWDFDASRVLSDTERARLADGLGNRGRSGTIRVVADKSRSQWRNRNRAREQLADIVRSALVVQPARTPTKPSRAVHRRRLDAKRHRSDAKRLRRRPDVE